MKYCNIFLLQIAEISDYYFGILMATRFWSSNFRVRNLTFLGRKIFDSKSLGRKIFQSKIGSKSRAKLVPRGPRLPFSVQIHTKNLLENYTVIIRKRMRMSNRSSAMNNKSIFLFNWKKKTVNRSDTYLNDWWINQKLIY